MKFLYNYKLIELIQECGSQLIYRGVNTVNKNHVLIKMLKNKDDRKKITAFIREYEIGKSLSFENCFNYLQLLIHQEYPVIVLENWECIPLSRYMSHIGFPSEADFPSLLQITSNIIQGIQDLHQIKEELYHGALCTRNIYIDPKTLQVKLMGFGNPMDDFFQYISPEQTGRIHGLVDRRTDLYSLGIILYQLFTGKLPFLEDRPLGWIHAHLAKIPVPPENLNNKIPIILSSLICKLMAKNVSERYQMASGVQSDIQKIMHQWHTSRKVNKFILGQRDIPRLPGITSKLYGREKEMALLNKVLQKAVNGTCQMVLITGQPGSGKTVLAENVKKQMDREKGYYIYGKFDQYNRQIPYASLIQAFQSLIRQLLQEDEQQLVYWKVILKEAVGSNKGLITGLIPEMQYIIGESGPVEPLPREEAMERFQSLFQRLVRSLTRHSRSLVIFLDDLQWADQASLNMLLSILNSSSGNSLLILAAYRENEIQENSFLSCFVQKIQKKKDIVCMIQLESLSPDHVLSLVMDLFKGGLEQGKILAERLFYKTGGNPLFLLQLLHTILEKPYISFDEKSKCWRLDEESLEKEIANSDVVNLLLDRMKCLPVKTLEILKLSACLGNNFNLKDLAYICDRDGTEILSELLPAVRAGLIKINVPHKSMDLKQQLNLFDLEDYSAGSEPKISSCSFNFIHDSIQQVVYDQISSVEALHLKLGRKLLYRLSPQKIDQRVFEIAGHYNRGIALMTDREERQKLAELDFKAGIQAKNAIAYDAALEYLKLASALMGDDNPQNHETWLSIQFELYECEFVCGNRKEADNLFQRLLSCCKNSLDKLRLYIYQIRALAGVGNLHETMSIGISRLNEFNLHFPEKFMKLHLLKELVLVKYILIRKPFEYFVRLPENKEEEEQLLKELFRIIGAPVYNVDQEACAWIICRVFRRILQKGNCQGTNYAALGLVISSAFHDRKKAYDLGTLGIDISIRSNNVYDQCQSYFLFGALIQWQVDHVRKCFPNLERAFHLALEVGNFLYGSLTLETMVSFNLFAGSPIRKILDQYHALSENIDLNKNREINVMIMADLYYIQKLSQEFHPVFDNFKELEGVLELTAGEILSDNVLFQYYLREEQQYFYLEDFNKALEAAVKARTYPIQGILEEVESYFYEGLTVSTLLRKERNSHKQRLYWKRLRKSRKMLNKWEKQCPDNFLVMSLLVKAEISSLKQQEEKALSFYDQAAKQAKTLGFLHMEALAAELAAKHYLARGHEALGNLYLKESFYKYKTWGGQAKVEILVEKYPFLSSMNDSAVEEGREPSVIIAKESDIYIGFRQSFVDRELDIEGILNTAQIISKETDWEKLLRKTLNIVMETAGAQRCLLILEKNGRLYVEGEGTADSEKFVEITVKPVEEYEELQTSQLRFALRTGERVVSEDGCLCILPLFHKTKSIGALYLENSRISSPLSSRQLKILEFLSIQIAVSIENILLSANQTSEEREKTVDTDDEHWSRLTERQQEILKMVANGMTYSEIGKILYISEHTVKYHVNRISEILQIKNRAQLIVYAGKGIQEDRL